MKTLRWLMTALIAVGLVYLVSLPSIGQQFDGEKEGRAACCADQAGCDAARAACGADQAACCKVGEKAACRLNFAAKLENKAPAEKKVDAAQNARLPTKALAPSKPLSLSYGNINAKALQILIAAKDVTILDARSGKYDDGRRIPGAKALNANSSEEEIGKMLPEKKAMIVTYCSNIKCPASKMLLERLNNLGYDNVLKLPEGLAGWEEAGFEITPAE